MSRPSAQVNRWRMAAIWLPVLFSCLVYLPSLWAGSVTDDQKLVFANTAMTAEGSVWDVVSRDITGDRALSEYYRPLPMLTFWLQTRLGTAGMWLHAGNLLLFAASVVLLGRCLAREWPKLSGPGQVALVSCWALHPLQIEAVAWLSGRFDLCLILAVLATLETNAHEQRGRMLPIAFALGLLCKETMIVMLLVVPFHDLARARKLRNEQFKYGAAWLTTVGYFVLRHAVGVASGTVIGATHPLELLRSYATLVLTFTRLTLVPSGLDVHRWYVPLSPLSTVLVLLAVAAVVTVVLARRGWGMVGVGLVLGLVSFAPISLVLPLQHVFGDRFASLWLLGLALAGPALLVRLPARIGPSALASVSLVFVPLSLERQTEWQSERRLADAALARDPQNPTWLLIESVHGLERGENAKARDMLVRLTRIQPRFSKAWAMLCLAELRNDALRPARVACARSLELAADVATTWANLATVELRLGAWPAAGAAAKRALELRPNYPEAEYVLAVALANQRRETEAVEHVARGLAGAPTHPGLLNLQQQLRARGY